MRCTWQSAFVVRLIVSESESASESVSQSESVCCRVGAPRPRPPTSKTLVVHVYEAKPSVTPAKARTDGSVDGFTLAVVDVDSVSMHSFVDQLKTVQPALSMLGELTLFTEQVRVSRSHESRPAFVNPPSRPPIDSAVSIAQFCHLACFDAMWCETCASEESPFPDYDGRGAQALAIESLQRERRDVRAPSRAATEQVKPAFSARSVCVLFRWPYLTYTSARRGCSEGAAPRKGKHSRAGKAVAVSCGPQEAARPGADAMLAFPSGSESSEEDEDGIDVCHIQLQRAGLQKTKALHEYMPNLATKPGPVKTRWCALDGPQQDAWVPAIRNVEHSAFYGEGSPTVPMLYSLMFESSTLAHISEVGSPHRDKNTGARACGAGEAARPHAQHLRRPHASGDCTCRTVAPVRTPRSHGHQPATAATPLGVETIQSGRGARYTRLHKRGACPCGVVADCVLGL